jgi:ABC-type maltose transport system permease subunit
MDSARGAAAATRVQPPMPLIFFAMQKQISAGLTSGAVGG